MTQIPYDEFGSGETIHFAHANGYPPNAYKQFLNLLGEKYHTLAIHHRPLWSDEDPWQTLTDWRPIAQDLINFLDAHNLKNIVGIGHSLGSVATFYASLQRPDLFSKIILIEPVFLLPQLLKMMRLNPDFDVKQLPLVASALKRRTHWASKDEAFERFRPKRPFKLFSDEALHNYIDAALKPDDDGFTLAYSREWEARFYALAPTDVWELIPTLTHPTLGIRGIDSDVLTPECWELWQQKQPNDHFIELTNCGHMLPIETPEQVAQNVIDWIKNSEQ